MAQLIQLTEHIQQIQQTQQTQQIQSDCNLMRSQIDNLFKEFIESPETLMFKELSDVFKTVDKNIKGFNDFLQTKAYKKKYPERNDRDRYNDMITNCMNFVRDTNALDKYLSNKALFFDSLIDFLTGDEVYESISESFLKGSFKSISEKVNRIFKPKEDDEPYSGFSTVLKNVKQYSLTFPESFQRVFSNPECQLYSVQIDVTDQTDPENAVKSIVYTLCNQKCSFFAVVNGHDTPVDGAVDTTVDEKKYITMMIASSCQLSQYESNIVPMDLFLELITNGEYEAVYIDNYVSLHSLKRLFVAKDRDTTAEFAELLEVLSNRHSTYFYEANYIDLSSFNLLSEDNLPNILKGIVKSGEDYVGGSKEHPHGVLASFQLNGEAGNLSIKSFWLSVEPIEDCVPQFDRDAFTWTQITNVDYMTYAKQPGSMYTEYLH